MKRIIKKIGSSKKPYFVTSFSNGKLMFLRRDGAWQMKKTGKDVLRFETKKEAEQAKNTKSPLDDFLRKAASDISKVF